MSVPCNGCTACCQHDLIFLHPAMGDIAESYDTVPAVNPLTGESGLAIRHKPEGGCIYVGPTGCTIHGRAPAICRVFDCRKLYRDFFSLPRPERRRLDRTLGGRKLFGGDVKEAGRARLHTLTLEDGP